MIKKPFGIALTLLATLAVLPLVASAGSMRCGTHLIQDGQRNGPSKYEIIKKCGQPTQKGSDTWVYQKPGLPAYSLKFNANGDLSTIREL